MARSNLIPVGRGGFTLAEIMIALGILATAVFVLLQAHFTGIRMYTDSAGESDTRMLLESTVSRAELGIITGNMSATGDFGSRWADYGWSYQAQMIGPDNEVPLYQVTATLHGPDGEKALDFFDFDTGVNDVTSNAELSGKSSVKRGAARGGLNGGSNSGLSAAGGKNTGKQSGKNKDKDKKKPSRSSSSRTRGNGMFSREGY